MPSLQEEERRLLHAQGGMCPFGHLDMALLWFFVLSNRCCVPPQTQLHFSKVISAFCRAWFVTAGSSEAPCSLARPPSLCVMLGRGCGVE